MILPVFIGIMLIIGSIVAAIDYIRFDTMMKEYDEKYASLTQLAE